MTYLGVGGWLIETPRTQVLTAPLFSNPSIWRTGLLEIESDTLAIAAGLSTVGVTDLSRVVAILAGHAHYDHLMDVPWVAARRAPRARVLTNTTGVRTLAPAWSRWGLDPARLTDASPMAADVDGGGTTIPLGPDLRVLPLVSRHPPHFGGLELYDASRDAPLRREPRAASEWVGGDALSFLFEVLDESGAVARRIYVQDAVSEAPYGLAPTGVDSVDVAVVVPASFEEARWHPEALLENLRPRHVLLGHWEDFFQPVSLDPDPVPGTNLSRFIRRLRAALDGDDDRWTLPVPGTRVEIR
jgi:L-ascorbate metabolism protein UlaG (beta-lactamase superfamily)